MIVTQLLLPHGPVYVERGFEGHSYPEALACLGLGETASVAWGRTGHCPVQTPECHHAAAASSMSACMDVLRWRSEGKRLT